MRKPPKEKPTSYSPAHPEEECIRVRLDHRTIVLIKSIEKFAYWKARYPNAILMDGTVPEAEKKEDDTGMTRPRRIP